VDWPDQVENSCKTLTSNRVSTIQILVMKCYFIISLYFLLQKRCHSPLSQLGTSPISCYLTAKMDSAEAHL